MDQKRPIPTERLRTIRGQMVERFSLDELRDLTFELGADWDQLPGNNKSAKTTELLELLNRRTQLPALLAQLQTLRLDADWALDDLDESAESPYKGLEFYNEADAGLFFGRERLIGTLLGALRGQSFMAVVGASGSGKSSVVRAGVVPVLKGLRPPPDGAALPKDSAGWAYLELTPTDRPLEQLALALTRDLDTAGETLAIIRDLRESPESAHLYIRKYLERQRKPRAFLLVDQFEELFTLCKAEAERAAFIDGLLAAAGGGAATVVLTLRADFYHHCLRYSGLRDALQQRQQLIGAMDEAELREAVEQPALRTRYELEPGLADKIVRDAGDEAGALPLLSHALLETWKRREGRQLTHAGYNDAGGVGGAIARTAERAYGDLDPARQAVARRIFLQLTELGEGAEDTRRRVALADLLPGDAAARSEAEAVLNALSQARLVSADDVAAQVSHEALIREWPALKEWLRDNREALRLERRLVTAAAEWDEGKRDASYLHAGVQLAAACQWAAANTTSVTGTVRAFLDAATAEEQREAAERERAQQEKLAQAQRLAEEASAREQAQAHAARTFKRAVVIVGVLGLAALGLALLACTQRNAAVTSLNDSNARLLLNQSESVFESDPLLADRLLLEAMAVAGSEEVGGEVAAVLADNLRTGRATQFITASVLSFTEVHTGTVYAVDYQLEKVGLISGATGAPITTLNGHVSGVESIPDSPFFVVGYSDAPGELRRTDDEGQIVTLNGHVTEVIPIPDNPFFVVNFFDAPAELRRTDDEGQIVTLSGNVEDVTPIPDSPFFVVGYSNVPGELRRTDDEGQIVPLNGKVTEVESIPDSPFFVVRYSDAPAELRRTDDEGQIVPLNGHVSGVAIIPDSPFFLVGYSDVPDELRRTDDEGQIVPLNGRVSMVYYIPDSPFFVVGYSDAPTELRRTDDEGQIVPLNGNMTKVESIPDSPFFVVVYSDVPDELRRTDDEGQIVPLNGEVTEVESIPDSPFFVVRYSDVPGELRRTDDEGQIVPLNGEVTEVESIPDSPFFVVRYSDVPGELRRADDEGQIVPLNGEVTEVESIPDSPFFVVRYSDAPGELRRTDDEGQTVPLNGHVFGVESIPDSPYFVVSYFGAPDELRRTATGNIVADESGRRIASEASVLTADRGFFRLGYQDGTSEIVSGERALVDLGQGVEQSLHFPETNRVAVRYGDGRVVYIDLDLIEAIGGADAEATLAAMTPEELVAFTCETLFTDNQEWDEAKLDEYLDFLPEGRARACGE